MNRQEERGNILRLNARGQHTVRYRAQSTHVECAFFFTGGGSCHTIYALSLQSLHRVAAHQEQIETNAAETLLRHLSQRRSQRLAAEDLTVTLQSLPHLRGSHLQRGRGLSSRNSRSGNNRPGGGSNDRCSNDRCNRNLNRHLRGGRHRRTGRTRQQRRRSTRHRSQRLTTLTGRQTSLTLRRARLLSSLKSLLTSLQFSGNILRQLVLERLRR